jgi:hypothetical protein
MLNRAIRSLFQKDLSLVPKSEGSDFDEWV